MKTVMGLFKPGDLWRLRLDNIAMDILNELASEPVSIQQMFSEITIKNKYLLKKILPQKFPDYVRRAFRSQAKREMLSAQWMQNHGISTPHIYGYGINVSPMCKYDSLLLMQNVENIGSIGSFLKNTRSSTKRIYVLKQIASDIQTFIGNGTYHKDAHFGNILLTPDYRPVWIDNDISAIKTSDDIEKFIRKMIHSELLIQDERDLLMESVKGVR